jgi:hypothetical protein
MREIEKIEIPQRMDQRVPNIIPKLEGESLKI